MRYLILIAALIACQNPPPDKARSNRVLLAVSLVNAKAQCHVVATPLDGPAPDTAYCVLGGDVLFCKATATDAIKCEKIGSQQAEQSTPAPVPSPVPASTVKAGAK